MYGVIVDRVGASSAVVVVAGGARGQLGTCVFGAGEGESPDLAAAVLRRDDGLVGARVDGAPGVAAGHVSEVGRQRPGVGVAVEAHQLRLVVRAREAESPEVVAGRGDVGPVDGPVSERVGRAVRDHLPVGRRPGHHVDLDPISAVVRRPVVPLLVDIADVPVRRARALR